jgi:hypothetical protein
VATFARVVTLILVTAPTAGAQEGPLIPTAGWRHLFEPGPADPGIGVLSFPSRAFDSPTWADSLPLYRRPGDNRPIGYFLFGSESQGSWFYAVAWPSALTINLLEFGYEEAGLPFDSVTADGRWARVIPGTTAGGLPEYAWAPLDADSIGLVRWADVLPQHDLFFGPGVTPVFFDAPGGRVVTFPLAGERPDYILHPLEARGDWLRVRAVTPSDMCADPESPRRAELWIRYLDPNARPLVWYHTRGC